MRNTLISLSATLLAVALLAGCKSDQQVATSGATGSSTRSSNTHVTELTLPSGSSIDVVLGTPLTSRTAVVGTTWTGSTRTASYLDGRNLIPVGSAVSGTVTGVTAASRGDRAMLDLGLTTISVGDRNYQVHGGTEAIVAGSTRARNLGAIGASAVAGAVIGHAVSGSGKGTIIGGLLGGGAATGVVSQTKGYQVELKSGTELTFTTHESVAVRI